MQIRSDWPYYLVISRDTGGAIKRGGPGDPGNKEKDNALPEIKITTGRVRPATLEDVARTGSKTDTPLRDIPASVDVVPASVLKEQGAITMNDAMRNVPSVQPLDGGRIWFWQ